MARSKVDWSVLRGTLGLFGVSLLLSAALLGGSYYFKDGMKSEYRSQHGRFRDASRKYLAVDEEERIIDDLYPDFVRLYRKGIIGREKRLNWIESLKMAGEAIQLPELRYKIDSQVVHEPHFTLNLGAYDLYASEMKLTLGLFHEGDLVRLLSALDRNAEGLYSVDECKMTRVEETSTLDPKVANIMADCSLRWFTVDLKGKNKVTL